MRYWLVKAYGEDQEMIRCFNMLAPEKYNAKKLKDILKSVHPEYRKMKLKREKRPDTCMIFLPESKKKEKKKIIEEVKNTRRIGFAK